MRVTVTRLDVPHSRAFVAMAAEWDRSVVVIVVVVRIVVVVLRRT